MGGRADIPEIETKFLVHDAVHARTVLGALGVELHRTGRTEAVHDVYLDTEERAVLAAGYGLRIRRHGDGTCEATLKGFGVADADGIIEREERSAPLPPGAVDFWRLPDGLRLLPDGPLRATVQAAVAGSALAPVVRVTGRRTRHELAPRPGLVVEVCDDRVTIAAGASRVRRHEVEVERVVGTKAAYVAWIRGVVRAARLRPSRDGSKLGGGAAARARPVPSPSRVAAGRLVLEPACGPDASASRAAAQALARLSLTLAAALGAARRGSVEGVHDVRTASRRLRAVLAAFRAEVPTPTAASFARGCRRCAARRARPATSTSSGRRSSLPRRAPTRGASRSCARCWPHVGAERATRARDRARDAARPRAPRPRREDRRRHAAARGPPLAIAGLGGLPAAIEPALARRARIAGPLATAEGPALHAPHRGEARTLCRRGVRPRVRPAGRAVRRRRADAPGRARPPAGRARSPTGSGRSRGLEADRRRGAPPRPAPPRRSSKRWSVGPSPDARALEAPARAVFAPSALRDVLDHLGKRAGAAADAR